MKIIVLGGNGFVGKNIIEILLSNNLNAYSLSRRENGFDLYFLKNNDNQLKLLKNADYIVNCAANVGSMNYVTENAVNVLDSNARIILNLYYLLKQINSKAVVINPVANCGYPGHLNIFEEKDFWNGQVHQSVLSYGSTRRLLLSIADCYKQQYKIKTINYYVPNMYGEYDSTDPNKAHALNALISKFVKSQYENKEINICGTGNVIREWLYAKDFGKIVLETIKRKNEDFSENINIGQNNGVSVNDLISLINFSDISIKYDKTKQDGASIKIMSNKLFKKRFPDFLFTPLSDGIKSTINYYKFIYPY